MHCVSLRGGTGRGWGEWKKEVERKKIKWPDIAVRHNKTIKALAAGPIFICVYFLFHRVRQSGRHGSGAAGVRVAGPAGGRRRSQNGDKLGLGSFSFHFISMYFLLTANTIKDNHGLSDYWDRHGISPRSALSRPDP